MLSLQYDDRRGKVFGRSGAVGANANICDNAGIEGDDRGKRYDAGFCWDDGRGGGGDFGGGGEEWSVSG